MKLSIITPYYDTLDYTLKLARILMPQLNNNVEWIIVDDGCHQKELDDLNAIVIHLPNRTGNASEPRNYGLDIARGEYIAFIDSDDYIESSYVQTILEKLEEEKDLDYCYLSWECRNYDYIIEDEPQAWNTCVWNCVYKKSVIGNNRFDPKINIGEDTDFNLRVRKGKKGNITKVIYHYIWDREGSLTYCSKNNLIGYRKN